MPHDVFISYSSKDKAIADAVCAVLEKHGVRCWVAPRDILPGRDWGESILEGLNAARLMVLVFSDNANASPQIKREVERAVNKGIAIIPLRVENVVPTKALEYFLSTPHWLDAFTPPMEAHLDYLAAIAQKIIATPAGTTMPQDAPEIRQDPGRKFSADRVGPVEKSNGDGRARRHRARVIFFVLLTLVLLAIAGVGIWLGLTRVESPRGNDTRAEHSDERWLSSAEYQKFFDSQVARGFYLTKVEGRLDNGRQEFRGQWESGRGPCAWISHSALSNKDFDERDALYAGQGYALNWKRSFSNEYGDRVNQAIWIKRCE